MFEPGVAEYLFCYSRLTSKSKGVNGDDWFAYDCGYHAHGDRCFSAKYGDNYSLHTRVTLTDEELQRYVDGKEDWKLIDTKRNYAKDRIKNDLKELTKDIQFSGSFRYKDKEVPTTLSDIEELDSDGRWFNGSYGKSKRVFFFTKDKEKMRNKMEEYYDTINNSLPFTLDIRWYWDTVADAVLRNWGVR